MTALVLGQVVLFVVSKNIIVISQYHTHIIYFILFKIKIKKHAASTRLLTDCHLLALRSPSLSGADRSLVLSPG